MSRTYKRIWVHAVWNVKNQKSNIKDEFSNELYRFIKEEFEKCGCPVSIINGASNHVHCLFMLSLNEPINAIIKKVKGSSSHYVNKILLPSTKYSFKFEWQRGYGVFSVSEGQKDIVYNYILNQPLKHRVDFNPPPLNLIET